MADIFVSYKSSDRPRAAMLSSWMQALGLSVWMDPEIDLGEDWKSRIDKELQEARLVVVLWGADALRSDWIRHEAQVALERGKLLQVHATGLPIPAPFNELQAVRMQSWSGESAHSERLKLLSAVAARLGLDVPEAVRAEPDELSPQLDYNLAEAMQLAFFYCARQLEIRRQMLEGAPYPEKTWNEVRDSFSSLLELLRAPVGETGTDREGILHRMVEDFLDQLELLSPGGNRGRNLDAKA